MWRDRRTIGILLYGVLVLATIGYVYWWKADAIDCFYDTQVQDSQSTRLRTDAADKRDCAELARLQSMRRIVSFRVPGAVAPEHELEDDATIARCAELEADYTGMADCSDAAHCAQQYDRASHRQEQAIRDSIRIRAASPPPNVRRMCG